MKNISIHNNSNKKLQERANLSNIKIHPKHPNSSENCRSENLKRGIENPKCDARMRQGLSYLYKCKEFKL